MIKELSIEPMGTLIENITTTIWEYRVGLAYYLLAGCLCAFCMIGYHCKRTVLMFSDFASYLMAVVLWPLVLVLWVSAAMYRAGSRAWRVVFYGEYVNSPHHRNFVYTTVKSWLTFQREISDITGEEPSIEDQAQDLADMLQNSYVGKYSIGKETQEEQRSEEA